jgi:phosphoglucosamine mutase
MNADIALRLGKSLWTLACNVLVIGRDTRESGPFLAASVIDGAISCGIDCMDLGIVSTPLLSYVSERLQAIGVMVTASHNPFTDNGLKVFLRGKKLFETEESSLEDAITGKSGMGRIVPAGRRLDAIDPMGMYLPLANRVIRKTSLRIALDCANGATYSIAPALFARTGADIVLTAVEPDGRNINRNVGSTHIDHLASIVRAQRCDIGFAFDGDGDRLIAVSGNGGIYDGDMLVFIIATARQREGTLDGRTVALTKMSNIGLVRALADAGINTMLTDVGDKYVLEALEEGGFSVGGESSGHIIDRNLLGTGDGVLNALHVLAILTESGKTLEELTAAVHLYPDRLENVRDIDKSIARHPDVLARVAAIASRFGSDGKVLVRASGTEPLIRVAVSAPTSREVDEAVDELVTLIRSINRSTNRIEQER